MSKSKWFKNKETGEVVYREGYTKCGSVVVRSRDRTLKWVGPVDFRNWYTPTNTSGFPPVRPKPEFNPYSKYYEKVGFFVPCAYTDKRFAYYEYLDTVEVGYLFAGYRTVEFVETLFRLGMLTTELQRKPFEMVKPAKPKFEHGKTYRCIATGDEYRPIGGFPTGYVCNTFYVGSASMERLVAEGKLITNEEFQKAAQAAISGPALPIVGKASKVLKAVIDRNPKLRSDLAKMLKPKKILVEWAIRLKATPNESYYLRLFPEGATPALSGQKFFKTGRTVEVPQ